MNLKSVTVLLLALLSNPSRSNTEIPKHISNSKRNVQINKCCRHDQIYIDQYCRPVNKTDQWQPLFTGENGEANVQINSSVNLVIGLPDCGHMQVWLVFHSHDSTDRLALLPSGVLRHYANQQIPNEDSMGKNKEGLYHDYGPGKYCIDKTIKDNKKSEFAWICYPHADKDWTATELMRNIVSPIGHGLTMICLLIVAIIYFIMPTLRDLTGNIITTICMCLIVGQTADVIRLLTVFKGHTNHLITETVCYISLLGAFFWLNSMGYYIWRTFKSRNVFLRMTDGKKYCYYSGYAWSCTFVLGILAVFAHFALDYEETKPSDSFDEQQEEIGSLGMVIFFVPVAFTVLVDVLFFATTFKKMNKMHTYGRIHHKLRHSFRMFLLLLLVMTLCWLFLLSSFSKFEGLINTHIIINAFQGPLILYVCILNQKHVTYLIRKTCCYTNCICPCCRPEPECEWGDEMMAMNSGSY